MDRKALGNFLIVVLVYSAILLFVGKQLAFIPKIHFDGEKPEAADLKKSVQEKFLKEEKRSYSIYYKNLKTGEEFGIDENKVQTAASLNKLPIAAYLYNKAAKKGINLEEQIIIQKEDIQDYGTGSLRYEDPGHSYSLKTLTKLALEQSDNTAAHVLGIKLDLANVQKYIKGLGFVSTDMVNNKTTAREMGKILELVYMRKITSEALTHELLDFMRDTDFEDRLARDIPKSVPIYHKAADGAGFVHDAGVIDDGKNPFILAIMTSDITDEEETKKTIGKIAKFIYDQQN